MSVFPSFGADAQEIRRQVGQMNPADAKARVEEMLKQGRITPAQLESYKAQAQEIARMLGL